MDIGVSKDCVQLYTYMYSMYINCCMYFRKYNYVYNYSCTRNALRGRYYLYVYSTRTLYHITFESTLYFRKYVYVYTYILNEIILARY